MTSILSIDSGNALRPGSKVHPVLAEMTCVRDGWDSLTIEPQAVQDIALFAFVLIGLVDPLTDHVEKRFLWIKGALKRGTSRLTKHAVINKPLPRVGQLQSADLDGFHRSLTGDVVGAHRRGFVILVGTWKVVHRIEPGSLLVGEQPADILAAIVDRPHERQLALSVEPIDPELVAGYKAYVQQRVRWVRPNAERHRGNTLHSLVFIAGVCLRQLYQASLS